MIHNNIVTTGIYAENLSKSQLGSQSNRRVYNIKMQAERISHVLQRRRWESFSAHIPVDTALLKEYCKIAMNGYFSSEGSVCRMIFPLHI
jgi:hypothetical protein